MQEKCFICSIDRDLIESAGVSFRDHIKHQVGRHTPFECVSGEEMAGTSPPHPSLRLHSSLFKLKSTAQHVVLLLVPHLP